MSKWDKMDREVWKTSEIMQELEKKVVHSIGTLQSVIKTAGLQETTQNIKELGNHATPAADGVERVADAVEKLESSAEDEIEELEEEREEIKEDAADLVEELTKLSYKLADSGDTSLAYKVERVIRDIESGFIQDED